MQENAIKDRDYSGDRALLNRVPTTATAVRHLRHVHVEHLPRNGPEGGRGEALLARAARATGPASSELLAQLAFHAPREGIFSGMWPGLTMHRSTGWVGWQATQMSSLSLGIIARRHEIDYLVLGDGRQPPAHDLRVPPYEPCWSVVLQIDPAIARTISAEIAGRRRQSRVAAASADADDQPATSTLDEELASTIVRFLRSLSGGPDRRVLGPLYLQETVFRVLQREQSARMLQIATQQVQANPVLAALTYIDARLAEPLTVETLAAQTNLSASAFTRAFRKATGRSPYQFVKETRLDRGRELLVEGGKPVAEVSRAVGYVSVSHFIKEFRTRFGTTPGDYADTRSLRRASPDQCAPSPSIC